MRVIDADIFGGICHGRDDICREGHIDTDMHASGGEPGRVDRVKDSISWAEAVSLKRWHRLASAQASFTTGTFLDVTGGK